MFKRFCSTALIPYVPLMNNASFFLSALTATGVSIFALFNTFTTKHETQELRREISGRLEEIRTQNHDLSLEQKEIRRDIHDIHHLLLEWRLESKK